MTLIEAQNFNPCVKVEKTKIVRDKGTDTTTYTGRIRSHETLMQYSDLSQARTEIVWADNLIKKFVLPEMFDIQLGELMIIKTQRIISELDKGEEDTDISRNGRTWEIVIGTEIIETNESQACYI
jgi:hypothetical protein